MLRPIAQRWRQAVIAAMLLLAAAPAIAQGNNRGDLWFGPNLHSADWKQLFLDPSSWARARRSVSVFQIADHLLTGPKPVLSDAELAELVRQLKAWKMGLAFEAGSVKPWGCTAANTSNVTLTAMRRVAKQGGHVGYLAMDEPLTATNPKPGGCAMSPPEIARQVAAYITIIKHEFPEVKIGDIEPWPGIGTAAIKQWIDLLVSASPSGVAFLTLDVDNALVQARHVPFAQLREIADYARTRGLAFRLIMWNSNALNRVNDDASEYAATLLFASRMQAVTAIDGATLESWDDFPITTVPDTADHTLTRLLRDYADRHPPARRPAP